MKDALETVLIDMIYLENTMMPSDRVPQPHKLISRDRL